MSRADRGQALPALTFHVARREDRTEQWELSRVVPEDAGQEQSSGSGDSPGHPPPGQGVGLRD